LSLLVYCGGHEGHSLAHIIDSYSRVIVFEPLPQLADKLRKRFPAAVVEQAAVGENGGVAEFKLYGEDNGSGSLGNLRQEAIDVVAHRWPAGHFNCHGRQQVLVINLAKYCEANKITEIDTLVTDTQGFDATIMESLLPLFEKRAIKKVQCEVDADGLPCYDGVPDNSFSRVKSFFNKLPYRQISGPIEPWVVDEDNLQADLVFICQ
jgi:FkbM family methyltransferase